MLGFDGEDEAGAASPSAAGASVSTAGKGAGGDESGGVDAMDVDAGERGFMMGCVFFWLVIRRVLLCFHAT